MKSVSILVLENNHQEQDHIIHVLSDHFGEELELTVVDDPEQAKQFCSERVFNLILMDVYCPTFMEGEGFIHWVKSFHSINQQTPIVTLTKDVSRVSELAQKYGVHPEAKSDHYSKVIPPLKDLLRKSA